MGKVKKPSDVIDIFIKECEKQIAKHDELYALDPEGYEDDNILQVEGYIFEELMAFLDDFPVYDQELDKLSTPDKVKDYILEYLDDEFGGPDSDYSLVRVLVSLNEVYGASKLEKIHE